MPKPADSIAFRTHDHRVCVDTALRTAREICMRQGARLTPLREQVLQLVWQSHKPLGAYALLEELGQASPPGQRRRLGPPTIYRALEFLQAHGLVHRINSLNAFIGCPHPQRQHHSYFLICRGCESTVELASETLSAAVESAARKTHFQAEGASIEITGLCPGCQS